MKLSKIIEKIYNLLDIYHSFRIYSFYKNKKIDCVIDVGSHKGEFITKVIRNKKIPIYSFEPQIRVIGELKKNTKRFNIKKYYNFAVSDFNGTVELQLNEMSSTTSLLKSNQSSLWIKFKRIILGNKLYIGIQKTKVIQLNEIFRDRLKKYKCMLLKIDVEGNEINVLKGAKKILINRNVTFVQVENARNNIYESNNQGSVHKFLINNGYTKVKSFLYPTLSFSDDIYLKNSR